MEIREDPWLLLAEPTSPSQLDAVLRYVEPQEEHHRSCTCQEEYREFLRKHGVEYDERYVGIEATRPDESRFQRSFRGGQYTWDVAPGW